MKRPSFNTVANAIIAVAVLALAGHSLYACHEHNDCLQRGEVQTFDCETDYHALGDHIETVCHWRCVYPDPVPPPPDGPIPPLRAP